MKCNYRVEKRLSTIMERESPEQYIIDCRLSFILYSITVL